MAAGQENSTFEHDEYRIFGPPGTGKTTRIAKEIARAARRYGSSQVVAVSFTKAAAREIGSRETPLPPHCVGTLHSFCFRALSSPKIAESKVKEWNAIANVNSWKFTKGAANLDDLGGNVGECPRLAEWNKLRGLYGHLPDFEERLQAMPREFYPDLRKFVSRWETWKEEGYVDFTDLILLCFNNVDAFPGFPRVGFFDEAQDFTPLELALVRKWGNRMRFFVVCGDDDQCIYAFKGATHDAFLNPPVDDDHKIFLRQSYRVPRAVHEYAEQFSHALSTRETKEYLPRDHGGEVVESNLSIGPEDADALTDEIVDLADEGKSVMILTTCSYMLGGPKSTNFATGKRSHGIIDALIRKGVPFHNPYRPSRGDWSPLRGGGRRLAAYLRPDARTWGEDASEWTWGDLWAWLEHVESKGKLRRGAKSRVEQMAKDSDTTNTIAGFKVAGEIFEPGVQWWSSRPETLVPLWLSRKRQMLSYPLRVAETLGRHRLVEEPKVVVGTIHSVKGGEADVVYLSPDLSDAGMTEWRSRDETRKDRVRRLFYVGATRAKERLVRLRAVTSDSVW